jgi:hypothetical protein
VKFDYRTGTVALLFCAPVVSTTACSFHVRTDAETVQVIFPRVMMEAAATKYYAELERNNGFNVPYGFVVLGRNCSS